MPKITEREIKDLCPWNRNIFPLNYDKWIEGFKAALKEFNIDIE